MESVVETISETITYYVMDTVTGYSQVLMELDENREAKVLYTIGDGLVSREQLLTNGESKTSLYLSDGHGDVRQLTDENGNVTDTYRYNAYGELAERTGNTDNPYLYTGEYYDEGTGLYYLRARYMNPETGTFISMDTYRGNSYDPASLHRYTYAQNNPQMYNDPSGHFIGIVGACINSATSAIIRNQHALQVMHTAGKINAMMSVTLNHLLGTGEDPVKTLIKGYLTGAGIAGAYIGATVIVALRYILSVIHMVIAGVLLNETAIQLVAAWGYGSVGNYRDALIHVALAGLSFIGACIEYRMGYEFAVTGPRGTVTVASESNTKTPIEGTSICGDRSYYSGGRRIIEGVDPGTLKVGNQQTLDPVRLNNQRDLIKKGIERKTLIQVTREGVIYDGHHGARAALEAGKYVDVEMVFRAITPSNIPLSKLPIRGSNGFLDFFRKIF